MTLYALLNIFRTYIRSHVRAPNNIRSFSNVYIHSTYTRNVQCKEYK